MHVDLHERPVADALEAVHFACLDDKDVAGTGFEFLSVHVIQPASFPNELDFIVRMTVRTRAAPRTTVEEEDRTVHIAVIRADEVVRAPFEWQILLPYSMHVSSLNETLGISPTMPGLEHIQPSTARESYHARAIRFHQVHFLVAVTVCREGDLGAAR